MEKLGEGASTGQIGSERVDQVIREDPAQHESIAGAPKNRQRILSVRRLGTMCIRADNHCLRRTVGVWYDSLTDCELIHES